jgi:hypothetical protein
VSVEITVGPYQSDDYTTNAVSFALSDACPPTEDCLLTGDFHGELQGCIELEPGEYYLLIDAQPMWSTGPDRWRPLTSYYVDIRPHEDGECGP